MINITEARYNNPLPAPIRKMANKICQKYSGWHDPSEIRGLWGELEELGIDVGILTNRRDYGNGCWDIVQQFEYNGEVCDNSVLVFGVYEGNYTTTRNDYNIYIS